MIARVRKRTPALISLGALGAAAAVGGLVAAGTTGDFDHQCRRMVRRRRSHSLIKAAKILTMIGEPAAQLSIATLASVALARAPKRAGSNSQGRYVKALATQASPVLSALLAMAAHRSIKLAYARRRPPGALLHGKTEPSFPSGHSSVTTAVACAAAYAARDRGARSAYLIPAAAGLAASVGLSRLVLDKHWATDVIAGWLVGVGCASAATLLTSSFLAPAPTRAPTTAHPKPLTSRHSQ